MEQLRVLDRDACKKLIYSMHQREVFARTAGTDTSRPMTVRA